MMNSAQIMVWLIGGLIAAILIGYAMWALFGDTAKGSANDPSSTVCDSDWTLNTGERLATKGAGAGATVDDANV